MLLILLGSFSMKMGWVGEERGERKGGTNEKCFCRDRSALCVKTIGSIESSWIDINLTHGARAE